MPEDHGDVRRGSLWRGVLTFGLVSIPVALLPANRSQKTTLHMTAPDGTPLKRRYFCPAEEKPLESDEIVRGYEAAENGFVILTDEELEALDPEKSREIDLRRFVSVEQVDPIYFDRAYFLAPDGDVVKPYRLLAEAMERTGRAGIATFVMRSREHLVAILSEGGILRAEILRFADEVRSPADVGLERTRDPGPDLIGALTAEIRKLAADDLDPGEMGDPDAARLMALVEAKKADAKVPPSGVEAPKASDNVIDLMEVLKRSLDRSSGEPKEKSRAKGEDLAAQSRAELYERAKELDIPGRSAMTKDELVEAIRRAGTLP